MVDSISNVANVAASMQQQKTSQQISNAVFNKAQDIQKQQGQAALALLESAKIPQGIDIHV